MALILIPLLIILWALMLGFCCVVLSTVKDLLN